ncbi:hypothetical protein OK016_04505 [Vibrio chagasii]|nr:hypothetical protein [Vibrio chagasii]
MDRPILALLFATSNSWALGAGGAATAAKMVLHPGLTSPGAARVPARWRHRLRGFFFKNPSFGEHSTFSCSTVKRRV